MLLRHDLEQGTSKSALARQLGVHRDTIHRWIRDGALDRYLDGAGVRYGPRAAVATKLDPYKAIVETRLAAYPELSAARLLEEIRAAGYGGGYSQLKAFVRRVRPVAPPEPVVRFETPAGRQAQVDFAHFRFRGACDTRFWSCWAIRLAVVPICAAAGHGDVDGRPGSRVWVFRRRAARIALRSDEDGDHTGPAT